MITKQQFIDSVLREIKIVKHLFTKITPGTLEYKPTEKQRTTLELLRYLSAMTVAATSAVAAGDHTVFSKERAKAESLKPEEFLAAMDRQADEFQKLMSGLSEKQLNEEIDLWGTGRSQSRALWLLHLVLKGLVAYKMQLFLYIKASGNRGIGTSNLWQGEDPKK